MSELRNELQRMFETLKGLETRARKLENKNLADIAASALGRVKQLCDHPDTELVDTRKDQSDSPDGTPKAAPPFDPNAGKPLVYDPVPERPYNPNDPQFRNAKPDVRA